MFEFMTILMVALRDFPYAGQEITVGQPFMATPDDAKYFILHGRARNATEQESEQYLSTTQVQVSQPLLEITAPVPGAGDQQPQAPEGSDDASEAAAGQDAAAASARAATVPTDGTPDASAAPASAQQDLVMTTATIVGPTPAVPAPSDAPAPTNAATASGRRGPGRPRASGATT